MTQAVEWDVKLTTLTDLLHISASACMLKSWELACNIVSQWRNFLKSWQIFLEKFFHVLHHIGNLTSTTMFYWK